MNIPVHDLSKRRISEYEKRGWKLISIHTGTVLSAIAEYADNEGFLPDNQMLVTGSKVGENIYECLLIDTSHTQEAIQ